MTQPKEPKKLAGEGKPPPSSGDAVHHLDGDPTNNDLANLRIVYATENRARTPTEAVHGPPKYDHRTLRAVGQALYGVGGVEWQHKLARDLDVSLRTMQRWASGDYDISPGIWRELVDVCRERAVDLKALATKLEKGEEVA